MDKKIIPIVKGTIGLFKALPMSAEVFNRSSSMKSAYNCAEKGFMVITKGGSLINEIPEWAYDIICENYGTDIIAFNQTFHKSFGHVVDMYPQQYFLEQLIHYATTYGAESIGVKMIPFIPVEELKIPGVKFNIKKLTVITALEGFEIDNLIDNYACNTVSPSQKHIELFKPLMEHISIPTDKIKSFELQVIKHDMDGTFPNTALSAFRYLLYKTTGMTYAIKNHVTQKMIGEVGKYKPNAKNEAIRILNGVPTYVWGEIFLRYKPIFLAYKHAIPELSNTINCIRRMAVDHHRPLNDICLQNVTKLIAEGRMDGVETVLCKASNRELIKVANALGYRLSTYKDPKPQVFNIRNGRSFVNTDGYIANDATYNRMYNTLVRITAILHERLHDIFDGKTFIIPDYIDYAVPTTEKQMLGNMPWGTIISCPDIEAFTAGIQWYDQHGSRVDLDLHMNSSTEYFGWNGHYAIGREIIYTGDQTAAPLPKGAAEAFWFTPGENEKFILSVNQFCGPDQCEFKFAMTEQKPIQRDLRDENFTFDTPIFAPIPLKFASGIKGTTLGMFIGKKFHIFGGSLTQNIVPSKNYPAFVDGIAAQLESKWMLKEFLMEMGGTVLDKMPDGIAEDEMANYIDLSPETLTVTMLTDIVDGKIDK